MKTIKTIRQALTFSICALILSGLPASAQPPASVAVMSEQALLKELAILEDRFFSRQYANDPTDKRLERLELLVFGATQGGSIDQRWQRLKKSVAERAAGDASKQGGQSSAGAKSTSSKPGSAQYPVLNTLEWRALKKTYPADSLDQRLSRLESKLFGQDSPGMPYVDRVDRLKRTLGIGVTAAAPSGPLGPAPKARPRGQGYGMDNFSFGMPGFSFGDGTGSGDDGIYREFAHKDFALGPMNSAFADLFADMHRQMAELRSMTGQLGPGAWVLDPETGTWVEQNTGKQIKPGAPNTQPKTIIPRGPVQQLPAFPSRQLPFNFGDGSGFGRNNSDQLPPYADPNSI